MLRFAAGRLLVGLFFLGVLHSLEVVLPARAIDGEWMRMAFHLVHVSSHNTHNSATVAMHLSVKSTRPFFECVDAQFLLFSEANIKLVMCKVL